MSEKKLKCYTCKMIIDNKSCSNDKLKEFIELIFDSKRNKEVKGLNNGNSYLSYTTSKQDIFSVEMIKKVRDLTSEEEKYIDVDDEYYLLRVGKTKDIQDLVKRNRTTLLGEGVLDEKQQKIYEIEVCTYLLLDVSKGIIIEMYGQYAPGVNTFSLLINEQLNKFSKSQNINASFTYNRIVTDKMIKTFKQEGTRLNKIGYKNYAIPSAKKLKDIGFDIEQINELEAIGELQLDVLIKCKPRVPLTTNKQKIASIINSFKNCTDEIKENLFFDGSVKNGSQQKYSFKEQEVTFTISMTYDKNNNGTKIPLSLDQIESQAYNKIKAKYENSKVFEYI